MPIKPFLLILAAWFLPFFGEAQDTVDTASEKYLRSRLDEPYFLVRSGDRGPRFGLNLLGATIRGSVYLATGADEAYEDDKDRDGLSPQYGSTEEIFPTLATATYPRRFYDEGHRIYFLPRYVSYASLSNTKADLLSLYSDSFNLMLEGVSIAHFKVFQVWDFKNFMRRLILTNSHIQLLSLDGITVNGDKENNLQIQQSRIDTIRLKDVTLLGSTSLGDRLPDQIEIDGIGFRNAGSMLDLTHLRTDEQDKQCELYLHDLGENIDQLKLNYEYFHLNFYPTVSTWEMDRMYRQLLTAQQRDGFSYGYEKIDKEYRQFKYGQNGLFGILQNVIDRWWWNYGYDKFRVVSNSIEIFLVFLVLNLFIYSSLTKVYYPEKFKAFDARLEWRKSNAPGSRIKAFLLLGIPRVTIYTAYVFWGVKLDLRELELRRPLIFFVLILEYVTGLVCIGYIANYIITK